MRSSHHRNHRQRTVSDRSWNKLFSFCFKDINCLIRSRGESILRVVVLLEFDAVAVSPSAGQVCGWLLLNCDCFGIKCAVLPVRGPVLASPREANVLATRICSRHRRLEDIVRICESKIPGIQIHPPIFLFLQISIVTKSLKTRAPNRRVRRPGTSVYDICRLQTADCRPQNADRRPQTADCRPQTA